MIFQPLRRYALLFCYDCFLGEDTTSQFVLQVFSAALNINIQFNTKDRILLSNQQALKFNCENGRIPKLHSLLNL